MKINTWWLRAAVAGAFCSASAFAQAQEATVYAGGMNARNDDNAHTYAWGFEYKQAIAEHFSTSFTWMNEGHVPDHHRDGFAVQFWAHQPLFDRRFDLAVGVGPYRYYDTVAANRGKRYQDDHGWGAMFSVAATWYFQSRWYVQARANYVQSPSSINSVTYLLGVGYQLEKPASTGPLIGGNSQAIPTGDVLSVMAGLSVVNSLDSQNAAAEAIEYRHGFGRFFDGTVSLINEGHSNLGNRQGIAAQTWIKNDFFDSRFSLGLGFGPYVTWNKYKENREAGGAQNVVAGLLTMSAAYRFADHWVARVSWNRVVTGYDRDSDIFLAGVGYKF
ncbi:hypothetical protein [Pandoraea apista]|uniref:hypothetical protein n=1 Tax=Pandoraea apista TaxID=93218 RepID=UPI00058AADEE|nr:hypothetical protein [Pandoraea apista]AJE99116.1 hypothetical protein SG18_14630 [Pandoraea apista]AKH73212.1 hypothetical protein XM39_14825 [Pandoraea apista]AKI61608.1 hypothetical protein AA956_07165 [Pandoraea apista]